MEAKQDVRQSLAEQMAAFEAKNGPVVTAPVVVRDGTKSHRDYYRESSYNRAQELTPKEPRKALRAAPRRRIKTAADLVAERVAAMTKDLEVNIMKRLAGRLTELPSKELERLAKDFALSQLTLVNDLESYGLKIQVDRKWTKQ